MKFREVKEVKLVSYQQILHQLEDKMECRWEK